MHIDYKTRKVIVDENFIVENDKNVVQIAFDCKNQVAKNCRLSEMQIFICYQNGSNKDKYAVTDAVIEEENILFSWMLGENAAKYRGNTYFAICAEKVDENGKVLQSWNTQLAHFPVLKGLSANVCLQKEEHDIIAQLVKMVNDIKPVTVDAELSTESSNAIANKAVANILSSGNLIGIERISSLEEFEQLSKKYEDVPAVDNQYLLLFVTGDIYSGEDLVLEEGLIVLTPTGEYKLTCNKEFEEFKKAVEMNFNLFFQALGNYATREKLEQVKSDLLRSIELLQSQTEQKITTNKNSLLQLTARVDELEKEWITVCDDTLTEDISFLLKTTDTQGNPFSFKKLKVYIYSPVNEATGNTGVRIINSTNYSDMDNILVQTSNWFMNTLSQHCVATVDCGGFAVTETNRGPTMDKMNNTGIMGVNFNVESITSVLIRPISTTAKMIPGTRIVVKGC
ncbi:MAG TPA: hypothetical protein DD404_04880 [Ruminococcaceae bacterium]|nr:hypothetical protein [Oscillospiraceae bacterium]